jgi:CDP-glucose 4,6-dehydratase
MNPSRDFWKGKRVLVTGHSGFKGAWLSLWLHSLGAKVQGFSLAPQTNPNLYELAGLDKTISSTFGDIRDFAKLDSVMNEFQPEVIFHLAAQALVRASYTDPVGTYATNVMGTVHLLESARKCKSVRAIVNVTSDKCYENREWAWSYRENDPMGGYDPYSSSKGCAELVTSAYRRSFFGGDREVGLASARAGNVIGGGDWSEDRLIPDCIRALSAQKPISIRNPKSVRPWQHVLEPLRGYLILAEHLHASPAMFSEGWNFGPEASQAMPVEWIVGHITRLWGPDSNWEVVSQAEAPHEAQMLRLDSSLAQARLHWCPKLDLKDALGWIVEWHRRLENKESAQALVLSQIEEYCSL